MKNILEFNPSSLPANIMAEVDDHLTQIESLLAPYVLQMEPDERSKFGSVNEKNKLVINKVKDYHDTDPQLASTDVDWKRFDERHADRTFFESRINRIKSIAERMENGKILLDYHNYQVALLDYRFTQYKVSADIPGYTIKNSELAQFFKKTKGNPDEGDGTDLGSGTEPTEPTNPTEE